MMSDHPVILQRNIFLTMRHFVRFGMSKSDAISRVTKSTAEIIGAEKLGTVKKGNLASLVVWNGDPFEFTSHPVTVVGEGKTVFEE